MIGRKPTTGPVAGTPSRPASQPHWKTATVAPKLAATDSRKPTAALTGTRNDRNTIMSRSSESPTTTAAKGASAEDSFAETSTLIAVVPVTATLAPVACSIAPAWPRISVTRLAVALAEGAVAGTTWISAAVPAPSSCGAVTVVTPGE